MCEGALQTDPIAGQVIHVSFKFVESTKGHKRKLRAKKLQEKSCHSLLRPRSPLGPPGLRRSPAKVGGTAGWRILAWAGLILFCSLLSVVIFLFLEEMSLQVFPDIDFRSHLFKMRDSEQADVPGGNQVCWRWGGLTLKDSAHLPSLKLQLRELIKGSGPWEEMCHCNSPLKGPPLPPTVPSLSILSRAPGISS